MDINKYQSHKDFDRNEAIFVLHKVDNTSLDDIAKNFSLAIEEVEKIIALHGKYEEAIVGTNS